MVMEYKIRFVDGGVNVTQSVTSGPRKPVRPIEQTNLGAEFKVARNLMALTSIGRIAVGPAAARPMSPLQRMMMSLPSFTAGGGETSPSSTGGGVPYASGLTIVFGSVQTSGPVSSLGSGETSPSSTGGGETSPSSTGGGDLM